MTAIPGVVFAGGWDGVLHALSTADGHELWQFNTAHDFMTVNGVTAKGGSLGEPGAVVVGGMVYVGSGYIGTGNGMPGNVLLAFGAESAIPVGSAWRRPTGLQDMRRAQGQGE